MKIIDPSPSGWAYGFPKELPDNVKDINQWLLDQGYPKDLLDICVIRMWNKEED